MNHFIIGTAGHIDHGKTALVKALTGVDTDRLKEEKERGITIDIGFAYWKEGITIIDVPGHERFIRNMVAGVSAIDFVLLVIAADDGIMLQTKEHLEILKLLQISSGAVVITKTDLVDKLRLNEIESEIRDFLFDSFLKKSPVFRISSVLNSGIEDLSQYLLSAASQSLPKNDHGFFRMYVDRVFSVKGFGTVLTGTVLSGTARVDQALELLPIGKVVRIRGLQKHTHPVDEVKNGDRAAINIAGIDIETVKRGSVLAETDHLISKDTFLGKMYVLQSVKKTLGKSIRIRLHIGTAELFGRIRMIGSPIQPGKAGYVRIAIEGQVVCVRGDRFIIREINSSATLGGGVVLDHYETAVIVDSNYLSDLEKDNLSIALHCFIAHHKTVTIKQMVSVFGYSYSIMEKELGKLELLKQITILSDRDKRVLDNDYFTVLQEDVLSKIRIFHQKHPAEYGIKRSELRSQFTPVLQNDVFDSVLKKLIDNGVLTEKNDFVSNSSHRIQLNTQDRKLIGEIERTLSQHLFSPPSIEIIASGMRLTSPELRRLLKIMVQLEIVVRADENLYFHTDAVNEARHFVIDYIAKKGHIKITDFKDRFLTSRKFALSLLEYFDTIQVTSRNGDSRVLFHSLL